MQITPNAFKRLIEAQWRFEKLKQKFNDLTKQLEFFAEPNCPLRGVITTTSEDKTYFNVSFTTITIGFKFMLTLTADGAPAGRVVCTLEKPKFLEENIILGSFTFKSNGITDFEVPAGEDKIEIDYHAIDIVSHYLNIALERKHHNPDF